MHDFSTIQNPVLLEAADFGQVLSNGGKRRTLVVLLLLLLVIGILIILALQIERVNQTKRTYSENY